VLLITPDCTVIGRRYASGDANIYDQIRLEGATPAAAQSYFIVQFWTYYWWYVPGVGYVPVNGNIVEYTAEYFKNQADAQNYFNKLPEGYFEYIDGYVDGLPIEKFVSHSKVMYEIIQAADEPLYEFNDAVKIRRPDGHRNKLKLHKTAARWFPTMAAASK